MSHPCLFNLEHYDCLTTPLVQCSAVVQKKFKSNLTTRTHRDLIPRCAEKIIAKGSGQDTTEIQAIGNTFRPGCEPIKTGRKIIFSEYLKDLESKTWQSFLQQEGMDINPYQLGLFLRERWKEKKNRILLKSLDETEERQIVFQVETLIELILNSFKQESARLESSMLVLINEIQDKKKQYTEAEIREKVLALNKERHWENLANYLQSTKKEGFSGEFICFLQQNETEAQEGIKWLEIRNSYADFHAHVEEKDLDTLLTALVSWKLELQFLFSSQAQWGTPETKNSLTTLTRDIYQKIQGILEKITDPQELYQRLMESENQLVPILSQPPVQWQQFKDQLLQSLEEHCAQTLDQILEQEEDMDDLKTKLDELVEKDTHIHLPAYITAIELARQQLNTFEQYSHTLNRVIAKEDPFDLQYLKDELGKLAEEISKIEPFIAKWAIFIKLKAELKQNQGICEQTVQSIDEIDDLMGRLIKESQKVLHIDLNINISQFRKEFSDMEAGITWLVDNHPQIKFLKPLQDLLGIFINKIFSFQGDNTHLEDKYVNHDFYQRVDLLVESGNQVVESLAELNNKAILDPVELLEGFKRVLIDTPIGDFILTLTGQKEIVTGITDIKQRIDELTKQELDPITRELHSFIPLVPVKKLTDFMGWIQALDKKIPRTSEDYSGYDELIMPFEEQIQDIMAMIQVQQSIHQQKFAEVIQFIKMKMEVQGPLKEFMLACIYYYEHLANQQWVENHWIEFFEQFGVKLGEKRGNKEDGILTQYETLFQTHLPGITPQNLYRHYKIFEVYLKESPLFPYISFITGHHGAKDLVTTISTKSQARKFFPLFHQYTITHRLWDKYVQLYHACDKELFTHFNSNPMKIVHDDLAGKYQVLQDKFIAACSLTQGEVDTFASFIPHDGEFDIHQKNHKKLSELFRYFQEITRTFQQFEDRNIWIDLRLKNALNVLESKCNRFGEEFSKIRGTLKWMSLTKHLRHLYDLGNKILVTFEWKNGRFTLDDLVLLENYDRKNSADYSERFKALLFKFVQLWEDFKMEWGKLRPQYESLKEVYNHEHFALVFKNWQHSELWRMWQGKHKPEPRDFEEFFAMLQKTRDNHIAYRDAHESGSNNQQMDFDRIDPYIKLMEEKKEKESPTTF